MHWEALQQRLIQPQMSVGGGEKACFEGPGPKPCAGSLVFSLGHVMTGIWNSMSGKVSLQDYKVLCWCVQDFPQEIGGWVVTFCAVLYIKPFSQ